MEKIAMVITTTFAMIVKEMCVIQVILILQ